MLFVIKLALNFFLLSSNIYKFLGKIIQFIVLFIELARPCTILSVVREITYIKKRIKMYNFRIRPGMCKRCFVLPPLKATIQAWYLYHIFTIPV
jgi:hypothetical protein